MITKLTVLSCDYEGQSLTAFIETNHKYFQIDELTPIGQEAISTNKGVTFDPTGFLADGACVYDTEKELCYFSVVPVGSESFQDIHMNISGTRNNFRIPMFDLSRLVSTSYVSTWSDLSAYTIWSRKGDIVQYRDLTGVFSEELPIKRSVLVTI